jgi:uroporphyrinogen III methyltransferase/synthase
MGARQLERLAERLIEAGRPGGEPAAVIERGTLPEQRVITATLETIAAEAAAAGICPPALTVIGPVAALREQLAWYERRPLAGVTVAVTRAREQASALAARLSALGAVVVEAPAIRIVPREGPAPELSDFDLLVLTSPNGVRLLFARLAAAGRDARALAGVRVAAIGPGTAAALKAHGVIADVVPERFVAEGLVEALAGQPAPRRALIARAAEARDVLPEALRRRGAEVEVLELYDTAIEPLSAPELEAVARADYLTFTSSSTVKFFRASAGDGFPPGVRVLSIGPVTSATLRELGREPDLEAARHDLDGLVEALLADVAARRSAS